MVIEDDEQEVIMPDLDKLSPAIEPLEVHEEALPQFLEDSSDEDDDDGGDDAEWGLSDDAAIHPVHGGPQGGDGNGGGAG